MTDWWQSLTANWSWDDPMLLVGLVTIVVTSLIPILLWRLGAKAGKRDSELRERQADSLTRQEEILRRQRRDALVQIVDQSSDRTHLGLLWREVDEYDGVEKDFLTAVFRTNPALSLPGTNTGVKVEDVLTETAVSQYVNGLERRYAGRPKGFHSYDGLLDFIATALDRGAKIETSKIVALVTGPSAEVQRPGHGFFRDLVNVLPQSAGDLLREVEDIDPREFGGLKLNVLTGTLLAVKDVEIGRRGRYSRSQACALDELRGSVPEALAFLLHRDNLRSFDRWSLEGSTDRVSATVAWLVRAVGWLADTDSHLAMRMIENLAPAIRSIPVAERGWGTDDRDVRQGIEWIKQKQPLLWEAHGASIEAAATSIGAWRMGEDDNE